MIVFDLYPRKCKNCGKEFEAGKDYAYKVIKSKKSHHSFYWFCSWHCLRENQKKERKAG